MRFDDLVGQEHVARTLSNAIQSGRVAHAFLFTGVRGVGKTTTARILAKALNCMGEPGTVEAGVDPGPTATPCLKCSACLEIARGTDVDVREIDGASYNGVDEVRKLQDSLPYRPARDRSKIFIVDEVHMLSQSAWNAFLKTLEEPPPHVKFIFATTEVHKIPVTILSRVQRFDFKLIPTRLIAQRLRHVLDQEGIRAEESAVAILAREGAGSLRDAMSLLDQVIAWGQKELRGDDVARVLGVASRQVLHDLSQALIGADAPRCLGIVAELADQGYDIAHVARDVLALLRDLVIAKLCKEPQSLIDLPDEEQAGVLALAKGTDPDDLVRLHQGMSSGFDDVVRSGQPRAALEMLLVRLARRPPLVPLDTLLDRLQALERRLESRPRPRERTSGAVPAAESDSRDEPPPEPVLAAVAAAPVTEKPPAPPPKTGSSSRDPAALLEVWREIVESVAELRPELAAMLEHAVPMVVEPGQINIAWEPASILGREASQKAGRELLAKVAHDHFGVPCAVTMELESERARGAPTLSAWKLADRKRQSRVAAAQAKSHPRVADALEIFGARLKDLKLVE
jgi:DNA polymerase-3 subunit gamma/tau